MEVSLVDSMGSDLSVVNAARVSFHKESDWEYPDVQTFRCTDLQYERKELSKQDTKLINYLAKHKHTSPFNHAFITVRVKAPIFVARQLVKHKFMPWNEVSRRYVDEEPEFFLPDVWRAKAENVKQGSSTNSVDLDSDFSNYDDYYSPESVITFCENAYEKMLLAGVCPEQARMVLPQNTMTEWWWSGSLGAFCDMLRLRLDSHTQQETREIAKMIRDLLEPLYPVSVKALLDE